MNTFLGTLLKHKFAKLITDASRPQCAPTQYNAAQGSPYGANDHTSTIISMRTGKPVVMTTLIEIVNRAEGRYFLRRAWNPDHSVKVAYGLFENAVSKNYDGRSPMGVGKPPTHRMTVEDVLAVDWELA